MISARKMLPWLLLLLSLPLASAFAQPNLTVGHTVGMPGATVNTPVSFTNNGTVVAVSFDLTYDPARVTPGTVTPGAGLAPHTVATHSPIAGTLRVLVNPPLVAPLPAVNSGVLLTVSWQIAAGATPGNAPLAVANAVFGDMAAQPVAPGALASGQVTITAP